MRAKTLWALWGVALGFSLLCAPAWAHSSHPGAANGKKNGDSSILLTTAKGGGEHSFLSQSLVSELPPGLSNGDELPPGLATRDELPPGLAKRGDVEIPPYLLKWLFGNSNGHRRGPRSGPSAADASAMPEPSALLFFGVGLLMARRSIGRGRS